MQINFKKFMATTLVELLAVLSILGVVAALTIPPLKKHSQKTEFAKLAQHAYTTLENALEMTALDDDTSPDTWGKASDILKNRLTRHIIFAQTCFGQAVPNACFSKYTDFAGNTSVSPSGNSAIMMSGVSVLGASTNRKFTIDVNGTQYPNRRGVDVFTFEYEFANPNCYLSGNDSLKSWKLCPANEDTKKLMENSWTITTW